MCFAGARRPQVSIPLPRSRWTGDGKIPVGRIHACAGRSPRLISASASLVSLLAASFLASTLIPISSEAALFAVLKLHAELAESVGVPLKNIYIPSNGQIILLNREKIWYSREKAPANYVMVDGLGVGDVGQVVLRDRQMMSQDGIFVVIATIDKQNGKVKNSPDIISRGFIYMRESKELLADVRKKVKEIVEETTMAGHPVNWSYVKDNLRDKIGQFLYTKTERRPMVIPVVIEV